MQTPSASERSSLGLSYASGVTSFTYMEGVSDEIVNVSLMLLLILVPVIWYFIRQRAAGGVAQVIHPQYVQLVNEARNRIQAALLPHSPADGGQGWGSEDDEGRVSGGEGRVSGSEGRVSGSEGRLSGGEGRVSGSEGRVSGSEGRVSGSEGRVSGSDGPASELRAHDNAEEEDNVRNAERQRYYDDASMQCPICYSEPARYAVETNCGHLYCARCILAYWQHGTATSIWLSAIACPVCRRQVSVFLPQLRELVLTDQEMSERNQLLTQINDYNRRFSGIPRPWYDYIRDAPVFLRHLYNNFFTISGLQWMYRVRIVFMLSLALLYLLSPLDLVPEAVFGVFGLLDDVIVVSIFAIYISMLYRYFIANNDEW